MTQQQRDMLTKIAIATGCVASAALVVWWSIIVKDLKEWRSFPKDSNVKYDTVRVLTVQYSPNRTKNTYYIMDDIKQDKMYSMRGASDVLCPFVEPLDSAIVKTTKRPGGVLERKIIENLSTGHKMKEYQPQR